MRAFVFGFILAMATPAFALTPNLPAGSLGPNMAVHTRFGQMANCIISAPVPVIPRVVGRARGVYAIDISVSTGLAYTARVLESSGNKVLDDAALDALQKWRFRSRSIYKLIVPIGFNGSRVMLGAAR